MKKVQNQKKRILASKRPKKRYVLFHVKGSVHFAAVKEGVLSCLRSFFGPAFESAAVLFVFFDSKTGFGFLKCRHNAAQKVRLGLLSVKLGGFQVEPIRTSGSLRKLKDLAETLSHSM